MGHLTGTNNPATIIMNESKLVIANFAQTNYTLNINYAGTGTGQVVTNTTDDYHYGDVVALMAVADVGSEFTGWTGDVTGSANSNYITINGNKVLTATFTKQRNILTTNTFGNGIVDKSLSQSAYDYGTVVELTAVPAVGWSFAGWSGDLSGSINPASINMTGNMTVYATFTQDQYAITLSASGQGNPTMNPNTAVTYGSTICYTLTNGWLDILRLDFSTQDITIN
jgi:uncharacterized repeat protein (TIGR02543 family)